MSLKAELLFTDRLLGPSRTNLPNKGLNKTSIGCRLFDTLADRISHDISKIPSAYRLSMRGKQNTSRLFLQEKAQDILRVDAKSVCRLLWL